VKFEQLLSRKYDKSTREECNLSEIGY